MTVGFGLSEEMLNTQRVNFHSFEGNQNGSAKEHKFRVLPAYALNKLFHKVGLHWGFKKPDGKQSAITCTLETNGSCPICDKVNALKGQLENITASLTTEFAPEKRAALETQKVNIETYVGDHRRKPMYLWNILTENGDQKVLQLSWNGHDPLFEKVKFIFKNQKVDVTGLNPSTLMYCNRSGLKAKTRYQYEMLTGMEKDLTSDVTSLTDLSKVYVSKGLEYCQEVVDTEAVPVENKDPNDRNFEAKPLAETTTQEQPAPAAQAHTQVASPAVNSAPATTPEPAAAAQPAAAVAEPVAQATTTVQTETPVTEAAVNLTPDQDKNVSEMMAALNN